MNLDQFQRIEAFDVTESGVLFDYVRGIESHLQEVTPVTPVVSSGDSGPSSGDKPLNLFSGIKSWAK